MLKTANAHGQVFLHVFCCEAIILLSFFESDRFMMIGVITNPSLTRPVIQFLSEYSWKPVEIHRWMVDVYGEYCFSKTSDTDWSRVFYYCREELMDLTRLVRRTKLLPKHWLRILILWSRWIAEESFVTPKINLMFP